VYRTTFADVVVCTRLDDGAYELEADPRRRRQSNAVSRSTDERRVRVTSRIIGNQLTFFFSPFKLPWPRSEAYVCVCVCVCVCATVSSAVFDSFVFRPVVVRRCRRLVLMLLLRRRPLPAV
jgi:hypothetical protein